MCIEKFEEFDARTGEGWIYVLRKSVTDVINARYSYHGCAMEGSCTHLAATITDRSSMKATASKAKSPVHCADKEEAVREHCGRSCGGFKPKRQVL